MDYQSIPLILWIKPPGPTVVLQPLDQGFRVAFTYQVCCWPYLLPLGMALALPGSSYHACYSCQGRMESLLPSCPGTC